MDIMLHVDHIMYPYIYIYVGFLLKLETRESYVKTFQYNTCRNQ